MEKGYILGIHDGHCATACLLKDGEIIACASEERFTNKKNESGIPKQAINFCLEQANITTRDIDKVVLASKFMAPVSGRMYASTEQKRSFFSGIYKTAQLFRKKLYRKPGLHDFFYKKFSPAFYEKSGKERVNALSRLLKINKNKIILQEHHEGHAYAALYSSGFLKKGCDFLILTLDGEGDGLCSSVSVVKNGKIKRIAQTSNAYSLGLLYLEITRYLGMKPMEHEYKVMGLAPYAQKKNVDKCYELIKDMLSVDGFVFKGKFHSHIYQKILQKRLKFQRFDWVAGAIQKLAEDLITKWVKNCIEKTGIKNVALSGGVFMNVKANMRLMKLDEANNFFIMPSCGDESLAIGACYYGYEQLCKEKNQDCKIKSIKELYFGPGFNNEDIERALEEISAKRKYKIEICKDIEKTAAKLLAKGEIVARCSGRMEWGARALGNRSILADASRHKVVQEINDAIKNRDFWMPFAPVIMAETEKDYVVKCKKIKTPYMILACESTEKAKQDLITAMHPYDGTIRPQTIEKEWNPSYHKILKNFKKLTGKGGMLNTSFNLHGYPIVLGPKEALFVFENSGLKYLVMNNYLVSKK